MKNIWYGMLLSMMCGVLNGMKEDVISKKVEEVIMTTYKRTSDEAKKEDIPVSIQMALTQANKHFRFFHQSYGLNQIREQDFRFSFLKKLMSDIDSEVIKYGVDDADYRKKLCMGYLQDAVIKASKAKPLEGAKGDELYTISLLMLLKYKKQIEPLCTIRRVKKNGKEWEPNELCRVIDNIILDTREEALADECGVRHYAYGYEKANDESEIMDNAFYTLPYLTNMPVSGILPTAFATSTRVEWWKEADSKEGKWRAVCVLEHPEYTHINNGRIEALLEYNKELRQWETVTDQIKNVKALSDMCESSALQ